MKFSAVKHRFKPISAEALEAVLREHARSSGRGESSVELDEVGLAQVAREVVREVGTRGVMKTRKTFSL